MRPGWHLAVALLIACDPSPASEEEFVCDQLDDGLAGSSWPRALSGARNRSIGAGAGAEIGLVRVPIDLNAATATAVVLGPEPERAYVALGRDGLLALDDQTPAWRIEAATSGPLAVAADGTLYALFEDARLRALAPEEGAVLWELDLEGGPPVGLTVTPEDTIVAVTAGVVHAVSAGGAPLWSRAPGAGELLPPAIGAGGDVLIASRPGRLWALDESGATRWSWSLPAGFVAPPVVDDACRTYLLSEDAELAAVRPFGTLDWILPLEGLATLPPVLDPAGGALYVAEDAPGGAELVRVAAAGHVALQVDVPSPRSVAADESGRLFVSAKGGDLLTYDEPGVLRWQLDTPAPGGAVVVTGDGGLLLPTDGGRLLRIE